MSSPLSASENTSPLVRSASELVSESSRRHDSAATSQTIPTAIRPVNLALLTRGSRCSSLPAPKAFNQRSSPPTETAGDLSRHLSVGDSGAATPRLPSTKQSKNDPLNNHQNVAADLQLSASLSTKATASPLLSRVSSSSASITSPIAQAGSANSQNSSQRSLHEDTSTYGGTGALRSDEIKVKDFGTYVSVNSVTPAKTQKSSSHRSYTTPPRPQLALRMSTTWNQSDAGAQDSTNAIDDTSRDTWEGPQRRSTEKTKRSTSKTHGDEQIEATLANEEPLSNARSRKASHYLGLFKENAPSQDQRKSKEKSTKEGYKARKGTITPDISEQTHIEHEAKVDTESIPKEGSQNRSRHPDADKEKLETGLDNRLLPSTEVPSKQYSTEPYSDSSNRPSVEEKSPSEEQESVESIEWRSGDSSQGTLPLRLLEDIRNYHSSPGPSKEGSRKPQEVRKNRAPFHESASFGRVEHDAHEPRQITGEAQEPKIVDDDEDEYESDKEHISSATYYPHQGPSPDNLGDTSPDHTSSLDDDDSDGAKKLTRETSLDTINEESKLTTEELLQHQKRYEEVRPGNDSYQRVRTLTGIHPSSRTDSNASSASESEYDSFDEIGRSDRGEESGVTDDGDVTPTATPYAHEHFHRPKSRRGPLGAVQLQPYKHQVGGHTKVFSFSKQAICKQLNNRENEFYEVIERRHPEMLRFLPRYLGVLNVTYKKAPRRKKKRNVDVVPLPSTQAASSHGAREHSWPTTLDSTEPTAADQAPRVVSHNQKAETQDEAIPQVIYANNLHIIPDYLFTHSSHAPGMPLLPAPDTGNFTDNSIEEPKSHVVGQGFQESAERNITPPKRPSHKQHPSWGATTVNTKLKEQVLREVFSPPPVHHYRRPHGRAKSKIHSLRERKRVPSFLLSQSNGMNLDQMSADDIELKKGAEERSEVLKPPRRSFEGTSAPEEMLTEPDLPRLEKVYTTGSESNGSSTSERRRIRRRRSASGLRRHQCDVSTGQRSDLEYFEDEGYGGDKEDNIFPMELADHQTSPVPQTLSGDAKRSVANGDLVPSQKPNPVEAHKTSQSSDDDMLREIYATPPTSTLAPTPELPHPPLNPLQAQLQPDERVRHFLLLEDLTSDMTHPCVLDLKMGTRQYGIEATAKKQASQRQKCKLTTSRQLGVRLCGMQGWNAKVQESFFEDKYAGREIKAGRQFTDALKRFLGDGRSERSVLRHIPVLLEKITKLEKIIARLPGYRFYASSLLLLYDGAAASERMSFANDDDGGSSAATPVPVGASEHGGKADEKSPPSSIDIKLVDFANCVTGEDKLPQGTSCRPQFPEDVDRGYLRGLRSLKLYLQGIQDDSIGVEEDYQEDGFVSF